MAEVTTTTTTADPADPAMSGRPAAGDTTFDWTATMAPDLKGYVQNKGFKDPASAIDSYRNLEKLMGAPKERLLRLPEKDDDAAGWGEIYNRLGRPTDAKGYDLKVPEGADPAFNEWAKSTFHEAGLTAKQAQLVNDKYNEFQNGTATAQKESYETKVADEERTLKKDWGTAYADNEKLAQKAARQFGITAEQVDKLEQTMGYASLMKFMHAIGSKVGEDSFVSASGKKSGFGNLTPEAAKNQIQTFMQDKSWVAKYTEGDREARGTMERLQIMANGGE